MTTAIDTNVLVALWDPDDRFSAAAQAALDTSLRSGALVIAAPVFAELLAAPGRDELFLSSFLRATGIAVDWHLDETTWRLAARAFRSYATRRRTSRDPGPRRILADFLIGAHAVRKGCRLLTLDGRLYRSAFPDLTVIPV